MYMVSVALPSMVVLMHCCGLIIIRYFSSACKKLTTYTGIYDIQLNLQNFEWAIITWMAGRIWSAGCALDNPGLDVKNQS